MSQGSVGRQPVGVQRASEPFMWLEAEWPRDLRPGGQRAVAPFSLSPEAQGSEEKEAGDREGRASQVGREEVGRPLGSRRPGGQVRSPEEDACWVYGRPPFTVTLGWPVPLLSPVVSVDSAPSFPATGHGGRRADLTVDSSASPQRDVEPEGTVVRQRGRW